MSFRSLVFSLLLLSLNANAAPVEAHHARVELIAGTTAARLTPQVWLGVHFSLEKDWHIYWVNPGDSGLPPTLKWKLPSGFSAGDIQWPRPEKLKRSTLADYGYQDDVVFLVPLSVPPDWKAGRNADVGLEAKWLICHDVCIADHADLHLSLSASQIDSQSAMFAEARKRLPKPWPRSWRAAATSDKDNFVLSIQARKPIQTAQFYPLTPEQIENAADQPLKATAHGAQLTLKKSDQLLKPIPVLKGLLIVNNDEAYMVQAPVTQTQKKAHNN
jgi:DsbC/DsbD-like thiol-disulfide interchange protein